jgi:hypothetical protein
MKCVLPLFIMVSAIYCAAQKDSDVLGDWEGESLCTIKDSPCHDEHVVYHVKPDAKDPAKLEMSANKIVNGQELYMGSLQCQYSATAKELNCHYKKDDRWDFKVSGEEMTGTLIIPENKLYRKVSVRRKR